MIGATDDDDSDDGSELTTESVFSSDADVTGVADAAGAGEASTGAGDAATGFTTAATGVADVLGVAYSHIMSTERK